MSKFGPVLPPEEIRARWEAARPMIEAFAADIVKGMRLSAGFWEREVVI